MSNNIPQMCVTNENLGAIVLAMQPSKEDDIFCIGGCGDQAFALVENGARVYVRDKFNSQLDLIRKRRSYIRKGDYFNFLNSGYFGKEGCNLHKVDRDKYFVKGRRLSRLRENIDSLKILESFDFF